MVKNMLMKMNIMMAW